jgi:hypothetical protein
MNDEPISLSGFAAFPLPEYRDEFSYEWLMGFALFGQYSCELLFGTAGAVGEFRRALG